MPVLTNQRHERFAQALSSGKTADEAYAMAGFKPNRGNASTLKAKQNIVDRVAEIQGAAAKRVEIDRAWVLARLVENVDRSMQAARAIDSDGVATGEYRYEGSVANKALELLGKELGMFVDRKEVRTGKLDGIEDEHLDALIGAVESLVIAGSIGSAQGREDEASGRKPH